MTEGGRKEKTVIDICVPIGAAAVSFTALVATLHPLDQTRLVFHPSQRRRGRRTHCPPAAQRPGLSDQPKPCLTLPPFSLPQSWRCGGSRACQGKDAVRLRRPRGTRQGVVAQRRASRSGEDAVDVQGLSPGPPGRPVAASRRTTGKGRRCYMGKLCHDCSCQNNRDLGYFLDNNTNITLCAPKKQPFVLNHR